MIYVIILSENWDPKKTVITAHVTAYRSLIRNVFNAK